ncbi:MAG: methytransferase partner Trm112 [Chloroflexi bacterium]|nr:methytransferase partner Trm112 [Chloroflexota bacterium]
MKKSLMDILACPICRGALKLDIKEERNNEVVTGSLYCVRCRHHYPISDSIPNLLPPNSKN